jgi:hypothetical protein
VFLRIFFADLWAMSTVYSLDETLKLSDDDFLTNSLPYKLWSKKDRGLRRICFQRR